MRIISHGKLNLYGLSRAVKKGHHIVIKPTLRCNLACDYCGAEMSGTAGWIKPAADMPFEKWQAKIKDAVEKYGPLRQVGISGGEPFLYKDIVELVDWLTGQRIHAYLYSNLLLRKGLAIRESNYVKINATYHIDAGERGLEVFKRNLADYSKKFFVIHQELSETWNGMGPSVNSSTYRELIPDEVQNRREIDTYGPDGAFYSCDKIDDREKYSRRRKRYTGIGANPLREAILKKRRMDKVEV